jgi:hypothetical protein
MEPPESNIRVKTVTGTFYKFNSTQTTCIKLHKVCTEKLSDMTHDLLLSVLKMNGKVLHIRYSMDTCGMRGEGKELCIASVLNIFATSITAAAEQVLNVLVQVVVADPFCPPPRAHLMVPTSCIPQNSQD